MPKFLGRSKVWGRGYTTIPVMVRRLLELEDGDEVEWFITEDGEVMLKKAEAKES